MTNHGVIEQVGTATEVYRHPRTLFVADFIGEINKLPATLADAETIALPGLRLRAAPSGLAPGTEVTAAIRPVDIIPHPAGAGRRPRTTSST